MGKRNLGVLLALGLIAAGMFVPGCAYDRGNLVSDRGVSIETVQSSQVRISDVAVLEQDGGTVITGKVSRLHPGISGLGHVDVTILDPASNIIAKGAVPYAPRVLPETPGARKHRGAGFEVRLSCSLPAGTRVQLTYHAGRKLEAGVPDCGKNGPS